MKPIALNTYDFASILARNAVYVDKTQGLHDLIMDPNSTLFFIARPRRFGKSLMISTLKAIFRGKRELFDGLAIAKTDYDWVEYPVLHFDFSGITTRSLDAFQARFRDVVAQSIRNAGADYDENVSVDTNFERAIHELSARAGHEQSVVILIDEYDSPVSRVLDKPELAETIRGRLADFYTQIKRNVSEIRFMMMTGVTKFTQLSVFSALNNLTDLTFAPGVATLLGYTDDELGAYFSAHLHAHADAMGMGYAAYRAELHRWYNGYRFSPGCAKTVYNPVAIGKTLAENRPYFTPTWAETGHASALMNYLKVNDIVATDFENIRGVDPDIFSVYDLGNIPPLAMLYQAGYLTIKGYDTFEGYTLGVPDEEVRRDLDGLLIDVLTRSHAGDFLSDVKRALVSGDFETFFRHIGALYAHLPYGAKEGRVPEAAYQRILHVLLVALGLRVTAEDCQSAGRADLVAETNRAVYLFELKRSGDAQAALAQIRDKDYAAPYRDGKRILHVFGLVFDPVRHILADAVHETFHP